jgi:hypothetical protein
MQLKREQSEKDLAATPCRAKATQVLQRYIITEAPISEWKAHEPTMAWWEILQIILKRREGDL